MAAALAKIQLALDASAVLADLQLLEQAADLSLQVRQRLVHLFGGGLELFRIDIEDPAAMPAGELRARLEFADPLRELASAVRAGHIDGVVVQDRFHG